LPFSFTKPPRNAAHRNGGIADANTDKVWDSAKQPPANQWADPGRFGSL